MFEYDLLFSFGFHWCYFKCDGQNLRILVGLIWYNVCVKLSASTMVVFDIQHSRECQFKFNSSTIRTQKILEKLVGYTGLVILAIEFRTLTVSIVHNSTERR